jgi:hypothetical protein
MNALRCHRFFLDFFSCSSSISGHRRKYDGAQKRHRRMVQRRRQEEIFLRWESFWRMRGKSFLLFAAMGKANKVQFRLFFLLLIGSFRFCFGSSTTPKAPERFPQEMKKQINHEARQRFMVDLSFFLLRLLRSSLISSSRLSLSCAFMWRRTGHEDALVTGISDSLKLLSR